MTRKLTREEAQEIGRKGGLSKSEKKQKSSRLNGKKGGRPRKDCFNPCDVAILGGDPSL